MIRALHVVNKTIIDTDVLHRSNYETKNDMRSVVDGICIIVPDNMDICQDEDCI